MARDVPWSELCMPAQMAKVWFDYDFISGFDKSRKLGHKFFLIQSNKVNTSPEHLGLLFERAGVFGKEGSEMSFEEYCDFVAPDAPIVSLSYGTEKLDELVENHENNTIYQFAYNGGFAVFLPVTAFNGSILIRGPNLQNTSYLDVGFVLDSGLGYD